MRILVTNDDGIDSIGLHVLVRAMCDLDGDHEVVVAAPDREFSGAGAALGALHLIQPEVHRSRIPDCEAETWTVNGPPGLCVMFARLGAFGEPFDLIVSGINPGANVGRAVYHSGTIGACLTGRNGNVSGVAVSQAVKGFSVEGQAWDEMIKDLHWEAAATVAQAVVQSMVDEMPSETVVVNVNVPDLPVDEFQGWRHAEVGMRPPRTVATAELSPIPGKTEAYKVTMQWGEKLDLEDGTDAQLVEDGYVAITYLTRLEHHDRADMAHADAALDALLG
ncbi:MAG: 5'/3'-nucleotidase SurE [Ilumatobacter sp.]|uniref:5'/3'-nucleotidase SurE n=1 Tax=Ilumatobacter sp. TaxID=1967498 RepID=UPI003299D92B